MFHVWFGKVGLQSSFALIFNLIFDGLEHPALAGSPIAPVANMQPALLDDYAAATELVTNLTKPADVFMIS
jgi:hypothetical protein